jgi:hypothetical protein
MPVPGHGQFDDPTGVVDGEALRHPGPERIADQMDTIELQCGKKVIERIGKALAIRVVGLQRIGQHIARCIPGDDAIAIGQSRELEAPMHGVGADAVQQHDGRCIRPARLHVAPAIAEIVRARSRGDFHELQLRQRRQRRRLGHRGCPIESQKRHDCSRYEF